jgi:hypothetical protein
MALMVLFIFIFAVLGLNFFGTLPVDDLGEYGGARPGQRHDSDPYRGDDAGFYPFGSAGGGVSAHQNFRDFSSSVVTLLVMFTGESWNAVMHDVMSHYGDAAWFYFVSYQVIVAYLFVNLVVRLRLYPTPE